MKRMITGLFLAVLLSSTTSAAEMPAEDGRVPPSILGKGGQPQGETVHYYPGNPETNGYLALPEGEGPHPAVVLIHEWNGLVDRIRQVADDFAAEGYIALAADMYSGRTGSNPEENRALVEETLADEEELIANLNAAVRFLKKRDDVTGKVAAIGWCYGGGVALSFALGSKHHDGTAVFYGRLLDDPEKMKHIDHEIYGTFAGQDRMITREQVDSFVEALRKVGIKNDVHIYDHVDHGFWLYVDRDPETNLEPARNAWERLKTYLKRVLGN